MRAASEYKSNNIIFNLIPSQAMEGFGLSTDYMLTIKSFKRSLARVLFRSKGIKKDLSNNSFKFRMQVYKLQIHRIKFCYLRLFDFPNF